MSTDYNYDEQGQFFPYFVLTVTGLFTLPITYSLLKPSKEPENIAPKIQSDFEPEQKDIIDKQRRKQKRRELKLKRIAAAAAGWLLMAWMIYLMAVTARTVPNIWDPYEILGLSRSADEKQIKSHYRKLSLTKHPDKVRLDEANNVTTQSVNDHWVEITKAFKTLTDEDIRNNYIQFGHPDGKQSFSIGIALPKFIVTEGNGKYVLLVYAALIGVLLPYLVGTWWYGTQKLTKDGILISSAGKLFTEYREDMIEGAVVGALSNGDEYETALKGNAHQSSSKIETRILESNDARGTTRINEADSGKLLSLENEQRRKILGLLWAYLNRISLDDASLDTEKYEVAPIAFGLNESFTNMTLAFANTRPLLAAYHISQGLVQAMPPNASPLLQLPHYSPKIVRAIMEKAVDTTQSVQSFMELSDKKRRSLAVGNGLLSDNQYSTAMQVASQLPFAKIEKAFFKVTGEKCLTPGSLIQLVVKLRIIPPGSIGVPEVNELDLEDVDPKEGDLDALHGRKKKKVKTADGKTVTLPADVPVQPPLAHAPYFARDHSPRWRVFLAENKSGKIAVPPFSFSTFDKPLFKEDGSPTYNVQTLKMQFQAPPQVGNYPFTMHLVSDSYVGLDSTVDVVMAVEEMSRATEIAEEEEISEPDEDSIAGQMSALRGTEAGSGEKQKKQKRIADAESSGSDTEGEEDSEGDSDTDTSTDEE